MIKRTYTIKVIQLLLLEYVFGLFTYKFFLSSSIILKGSIFFNIPSGLILRGMCITLLLKERKEGYIIAWVITILSILSIIGWGIYFHLINSLTNSLLFINFLQLAIDVALIKVLYFMRPDVRT